MRGALISDEKIAISRFVRHEATGPGTYDARGPIGIRERHLQARHADCFIGGSGSEPGVPVGECNDAIALEMFETLLWIEILDLRRNQNFEVVNRKAV